MVFFVCEFCNESLKKNKVETHSYSCRNCWVLTCVDCNKQFTGETYAAHTACMSEAQRYEGKLYDGRTNKGDVKQALWIDRVRECAADPSVQPHLRPHVERLLGHDNIPRKKAKFENFAKNSLRVHDPKTLSALWSIFEKATIPIASSSEPGSGDAPPTGPAQTPSETVGGEQPAAAELSADVVQQKAQKREKKASKEAQAAPAEDAATKRERGDEDEALRVEEKKSKAERKEKNRQRREAATSE